MARRNRTPQNRWLNWKIAVPTLLVLVIVFGLIAYFNQPKEDYFIPFEFPAIPLNGYGELYIGDKKLEGSVVIILDIKVHLSDDGMTATGAEILLKEIWLSNLDQVIFNAREDGSIGQITLHAFNEMPLLEGHLDTTLGRIEIPYISIPAGDNSFSAGNIQVFPLSWDNQGNPIRGGNLYRQI